MSRHRISRQLLRNINRASSVRILSADLSCRNTKQQVGALFTRSNFVTLKYVTDNWGTDANGFKLIITSVKDPSEYVCWRLPT
ncbi:hypothetical protein EVAR_8992_1 [Eumeta japonica]|uniref:Uncharacterized protein n=1 Tax=Eumeta variegata TaxID=151549 RepID=A0A4C1WSZ9_EUMVA|nr:hypothetical protein EVAR_8992_1 [Eumeta japonica]